mgnify:CR=1 FL=1
MIKSVKEYDVSALIREYCETKKIGKKAFAELAKIQRRSMYQWENGATMRQSTFESIGKLQNSFSMKVALGFDQTRFGQQAKKIDPTGQLKRIDDGTQHTISISWLGMNETEKEFYRQEKAMV